MAHNIETMAYTNEVPWHGLGAKLEKAPTVEGMLKAAQLDWQVERAPMFTQDGQEIPGFAALRRSSDNKVLDVVGSRYQPVQNAEAFDFFNEFVKAGKATMETAGSLRGGQLVWGLANMRQEFEVSKGDKVKGYLLCVAPHQQGKSLIFRTTTVRVVCNNTLTLALKGKGNAHRVSHAKQFTTATIEQAKEALGLAREQVAEFEVNAKKLHAKKLSKAAMIELLAPLFKCTPDDMSKPMQMVMQSYELAPGAEVGTAWGSINAVTHWADHVASRTQDKRLTNAWLGKTANLKEAALKVLLEA